MYYKNLTILVIIFNIWAYNVVWSRKNYLRGIDLFKMLQNSERRLSPRLTEAKYSCRHKQDEGYYVHKNCRKYWHCLYVGTVFEEALERKCPAGTMFHPIQRNCEMSPTLNCLRWYQYIYGKDSIPNNLYTDQDVNLYSTSTSKKKLIDTSQELNELLVTFNQFSKLNPIIHQTELTDYNFETKLAPEKTQFATTMPTIAIKPSILSTTTTTKSTTTTTTTYTTTTTSTINKIVSSTTRITIKSTKKASPDLEEEKKNVSKLTSEYMYDDLEDSKYKNYYDDYYYNEYSEPNGSYKIQINTTQPILNTSITDTTISSKFTTLFSSNLLEKFRNFNNENNKIVDEKNNSKIKNYTILSSNGKKTFIAEDKLSNSGMDQKWQKNRILTTKAIKPVQIIKNIFVLNNRSNFDKNYVPNLSSRFFVTEKMLEKTGQTSTEQNLSYYEDVETAEAEEVEYMDNELMEVNPNLNQDLLLNLQLNIDSDKMSDAANYQDYTDEGADNFFLADEAVSPACRLALNLNIFFILKFSFYLLFF